MTPFEPLVFTSRFDIEDVPDEEFEKALRKHLTDVEGAIRFVWAQKNVWNPDDTAAHPA